MTKMTKVEMFELIKAQLTDDEQIAFIDNEIRMVKARNSRRSSKPSAKDVENADLMAKIVTILTDADAPKTTAQVRESMGAEFSPQKITALLKKLETTGRVTKTETGNGKRKTSLFALA